MTSPAGSADRPRDKNPCVWASIGSNDRGYILLPLDIDRDAYQRCMEKREHDLPPPGYRRRRHG